VFKRQRLRAENKNNKLGEDTNTKKGSKGGSREKEWSDEDRKVRKSQQEKTAGEAPG
jgi:hypothetical protein